MRTHTDARHAAEADTLLGAVRLFYRFPVPWLLTIQLLVVVALRLWVGGGTAWELALVAVVVVWWPIQEWTAHIWLLHFRPRRVLGFTIDPFAARAHRWHHRHPHVLEGVFVPVHVIGLLIPIHAGLWWLLMPNAPLAFTGMAAYTATTVAYEWTHFLVHTRYRPRSAYGRTVFGNHRLHHFKNENYWHAFTVPAIDRWMGTDPDAATVETSPTVMTLGVDD